MRFAEVQARLHVAIHGAVDGLSYADAAQRVVRLMSATFFPVVFPGVFGALAALETQEQRATYAAQLARDAFMVV